MTVLSAEAVASCRTSGLNKHFRMYLPAEYTYAYDIKTLQFDLTDMDQEFSV